MLVQGIHETAELGEGGGDARIEGCELRHQACIVLLLLRFHLLLELTELLRELLACELADVVVALRFCALLGDGLRPQLCTRGSDVGAHKALLAVPGDAVLGVLCVP